MNKSLIKIFTGMVLLISTTILVCNSANPEEPAGKETSVVLDPAFGGTETGAVGQYKLIEKEVTLAVVFESENRLQGVKSRGETLWGSEKWVKDSAYYQSLDTCRLAEECFKGLFYNEMNIYDHPEEGFARLKIMHNGFAELFKREDMWKGILHAYEYLGAGLNPQGNRKEYFIAGSELGALWYLYELPEFKAQVAGREKLFLAANINALKQFKSFMEWFEEHNVGDTMPFFREPCVVAQTALMLYKQINPQDYARIEPSVKSVRWSKGQQHRKNVIDYLDLVIRSVK